jgi:hypothetical protein
MSSETVASSRPAERPEPPTTADTGSEADRQAAIEAALQAMMRDVPVSPRLLQVLEELDDEAPRDGDGPTQPEG